MDGVSDVANMVSLVGAEYPILADPAAEAVLAYHVYNLLGDKVATPSAFVIGADGTIRWSYVGKTIADRPSVDVLLAQSKGR